MNNRLADIWRIHSQRFAAMALVLLLGCGQETLGTIANLSGANDLIQSGDLVFVTSSDRDELRAIKLPLVSGSTIRDYVRAPNPLEALSIPTVDDPVQIAVDRTYDAAGNQHGGQYVYARSDGAPAISVITAADITQLKELRRIYTGNAVTTIAAIGAASVGGASQLFYTTWDGVRATLWEVDVPAPASLAEATLAPKQVISIPGTAVRAMLVLPTGELVLAVRPSISQTRQTWVINPTTLATRDLQFPIPVRGLYTHGVGGTTPAGARIFGILDEQYCSDASLPQCPGIYVVDSQTGAQVMDWTGYPMTLPIGPGLPQGMVIASNAHLNTVSATTDAPIALLGVFTTSAGPTQPAGGDIYFFDAQKLSHFDTNTTGAAQVLTYEDSIGTARTYAGGPVPASVSLGEGGVVSEDVFITYQGLIPGLTDLPKGAAETLLTLPLSGPAMTNDVVVLGPSAAPCGADIPIQVTDGNGSATAQLLAPIPDECASETTFSVRASGTLAYVVNASVQGYLGRTGANTHFSYVTTYYEHPAGYQPTTPVLQFDFGAADSDIERDWRYHFVLTSNYTPYVVFPDTATFVDYYLPGAVALDEGLGRAFVAYPSTPSVMELDTTQLVAGSGNTTESMIEHR